MLPKSTRIMALFAMVVSGTFAFGWARSAPVRIAFVPPLEAAAYQDDADSAAKIESAMSAAPLAVAENAAIVDYTFDDDGKFVVLRAGDNGWTCLPDNPDSPGPDPWCMDQTWLDWAYSFYAGEDPVVTVPGFSYMLGGGSDPSNTDPFATEPAEGEEWVNSPAHVMLLMPGELDQTAFSTDHESHGPYIMFAGTPYEHIMFPVAEVGEMASMSSP